MLYTTTSLYTIAILKYLHIFTFLTLQTKQIPLQTE